MNFIKNKDIKETIELIFGLLILSIPFLLIIYMVYSLNIRINEYKESIKNNYISIENDADIMDTYLKNILNLWYRSDNSNQYPTLNLVIIDESDIDNKEYQSLINSTLNDDATQTIVITNENKDLFTNILNLINNHTDNKDNILNNLTKPIILTNITNSSIDIYTLAKTDDMYYMKKTILTKQ